MDNSKQQSETSITKENAWDYALGMIKVDGLEPSDEFKLYVELEKTDQITTKDIKKLLDKKYKMKVTCDE